MFLRRFLRPGTLHFAAVYGMLFFFSGQVALALYTNSSFLSAILDHSTLTSDLSTSIHERIIGVIYAAGALAALLALILLPRFMRRFGNFRVTLTVLLTSVACLLTLAFSKNLVAVILAFLVEGAMISSLYLAYDVFVEQYAKTASMGLIRGTGLTIAGIAWMFPPSAAGILAAQGDYMLIYAGGAVLLIPAFFFLIFGLRDFKDPKYHVPEPFKTVKEINKHRDIKGILTIQFILQFFYAWMVIYAPLYLSEHLGVSWEIIGLSLTIALSAFIIFEIPAGQIADRWLGEKELLVLGFSIMAIGSFIIPFVKETTLVVWATVFFIGRMGASILETMSETYFFKVVDPKSANIISSFRLATPLATLASSILAALVLAYASVQHLFVILAVILVWGATIALQLKDTK